MASKKMVKKEGIYIHASKDNWLKEKNTYNISIQNVQTAYANQRRKYSEGAKILKYKKVYKRAVQMLMNEQKNSEKLTTKTLQMAYDIIMSNIHSETRAITHMRFDDSQGLTNITNMVQGKKETAVDRIYNYIKDASVEEVLEYMWSIDAEFELYMTAAKELHNNVGGVVSPYDVDKLSSVENTLSKIMGKYYNGEVPDKVTPQLAEEIRQIGHAISSAFIGGVNEFAAELRPVLNEEAQDQFLQAAKSVANRTGLNPINLVIDDSGLGKSRTKTNSKQSQVSKSDQGFTLEIKENLNKGKGSLFFGINVKSYQKAYPWSSTTPVKGQQKGFVGGTSYENLFQQIHNIKVENYFVNEYIHSKGAVMNDPNDVVMKYITARASSYILSGGAKDQLSYFLVTGKDLLYIPALLSQMGKEMKSDTYSFLRLSAREEKPIESNEKVPGVSAEERSLKVYNSLRDGLVFDAAASTMDFYSLLKGTRYDV